MITLSKRWCDLLLKEPETGMGYHIVSVTLHDGRRYDRAIVDSGYLTRIKDVSGIPFAESDIAEMVATHEKWDFNGKP
jgi:hypothetical protein